MEYNSEDEQEWTPPTEAEMKLIEARRERSDKISRLMGNYMLKGYKMLGITCNICYTILLKDRDEKDYCVNCEEVSTETAKDDPAVSSLAAAKTLLEAEHSSQHKNSEQAKEPSTSTLQSTSAASTSAPIVPQASVLYNPNLQCHSQGDKPGAIPFQSYQVTGSESVNPIALIKKKIADLTIQMTSTASVTETIQLCDAIKACGECLTVLQRIV